MFYFEGNIVVNLKSITHSFFYDADVYEKLDKSYVDVYLENNDMPLKLSPLILDAMKEYNEMLKNKVQIEYENLPFEINVNELKKRFNNQSAPVERTLNSETSITGQP